ncbi:MAG: hypothetical protein ACM3ZC_14975 [Bacteroidota bacterium]
MKIAIDFDPDPDPDIDSNFGPGESMVRFPNRQSPIRLAGAVVQERQDEWDVASRRYFSRESMAKVLGDLPPPK